MLKFSCKLLFALTFLASAKAQQNKTVVVQANQLYQTTAVQVQKGETYRITATGQWQDADFPPTDGNGFKGFTAPMFFGMLLKPMPGQNYMKLCGKVGNWKFPIGTDATVTMKRTGELRLFANDAKGFFGNNSGSLQVTLTLVAKDTVRSFKPRLLPDGTFVPRNANATFGRKMWRGALFVHGFEAIGYGTLALLPTEISGWEANVFPNYPSNMKRA